jgi:ribose transport system substrate-binding protein
MQMNVFKKIFFFLAIVALLAACAPQATPQPAAQQPTQPPAEPQTAAQKLTYCYITPGPDTWYKRDVEGFQAAAKQDGVDVIVVNSDYDVEKELANIDYCINQGVNGISVFSFNENGARIAAERGKKAGIPVVATDSVGSVKAAGQEIVAEIDFDWTKMGETYAQWMAENYPGEDVMVITGNFESIPMQKINDALKANTEKLGKNKILDIREGEFNPNKAVEVAQDMLQSGADFKLLFVSDEDMGAAVIRMLKDKGVLNNPIKVISENGSTAGIPLVKSGELKFTISSSPGWEGYVAYLALHNNVIGKIKDINQQVMLPIMPISDKNIDDPLAVVPWEVDPDLYAKLTKQYMPALLVYRE